MFQKTIIDTEHDSCSNSRPSSLTRKLCAVYSKGLLTWGIGIVGWKHGTEEGFYGARYNAVCCTYHQFGMCDYRKRVYSYCTPLSRRKGFPWCRALLLFVHLGDWDSWMETREQKRGFIASAITPCDALITDLGCVIAQNEFIVIAPLLSR
ncbi:hypothetical protein CEXT_55181 [Caerostris extrusa]|uniref:Uncharacterized protein n=1 Tax=Caerostris extrusa TaxID=172846 RepID=A0AAV4WQU4_CAEEX|nr:hypothetical protein CEXT_55181 [Caerostris extrusa]